MINHNAEKKASYRNRVQRGTYVTLARPVQATITTWDPEFRVVSRKEFPAGTECQVVGESNGGFRGIEATLKFPGGYRAISVSTGALKVR